MAIVIQNLTKSYGDKLALPPFSCTLEAGEIVAEGVTAGFKYFDCRGVRRITLRTRGYAGGCFEVRTDLEGEPLGKIPLGFRNQWTAFSAEIPVPDGIHALYFTYRGPGTAMLASFALE